MHSARTVHVRGQLCPRTARAVSPAQGDGREISVPEGLRPLSRLGCRNRDAQSSAGTLVAAVPRPRNPTLPVIRGGERAQHKVTRKEKPGQAHQRGQRAPPLRPDPHPPHPDALRVPGQTHRAGPGRAGLAAPLRALRAHRRSRRGAGARPARAAAALWFVASLLLQTTPASPRRRAVPRAAASAVICPSAPPLASQMVLERGHGGRRGNALILLLGCVLTSWWSCLKVRKAAETRNLAYYSYQSKGDLGRAEPFLCPKLAQVKS